MKSEGWFVGAVPAETKGGLGLYVLSIWPNAKPGDVYGIARIRMRLGLPGQGIVLNNWRVVAGTRGAWLASPTFKAGVGRRSKQIPAITIEDKLLRRAVVAFVLEELKKSDSEFVEESRLINDRAE